MHWINFKKIMFCQHRRWSEFESAGANWNVRGAVGIEMLKFEAKKGDFAKIRQKLGGL